MEETSVSSLSFYDRYMVSGTRNMSSAVRIWDLSTCKCIKVLEGHIDKVKYVKFSPNGKYVVSTSEDNTIRIWEVKTGKCKNILTMHTRCVNSVSFSPDGKYLLSASDDESVRVWEVETGKCINLLLLYKWVFTALFSSDGNIITGGGDNRICTWHFKTRKPISIWKGHTKWVTCLCYSPDLKYIASGSEDNTVRIWEVKTGECIKILSNHIRYIHSLEFFQDGNYLISSSYEIICIWDTKTWKPTCIKPNRLDSFSCASVYNNNLYVGTFLNIKIFKISSIVGLNRMVLEKLILYGLYQEELLEPSIFIQVEKF